LSKGTAAAPIRLALKIEDPALADRLAKLLANVPGLQLVGAGAFAEVTLLHSNGMSGPVEGDVPLTPRELEVLTLLAEGLSNKANSSPTWHIRPHGQVPRRCGDRQARCGRAY
jgi:ATP/maltotriose-dependent transcriptional regulator MalT